MHRTSLSPNGAVTVAFCAGPRTVGAAVLFGTTLGGLVTTRIRRQGPAHDEVLRVRRWAEQLVGRFGPALVVLLEDEPRLGLVGDLADALGDAAACHGVRVIPVQRAEIARVAGLDTDAAKALVAWLRAQRLPVLDGTVRRSGWRGGLRSESERYHEPAMLAAAAAIAFLLLSINV